MAAGISIFSDSSTIQIDDRYATYGLIEKGVTRDASLSRLVLTALRPVVDNTPINIGTTSNSYDIALYKFGLSSGVNDNFGLQVFSADGNTLFHSSRKPIRVIDFIRKPTKKSNGSMNLDTTTHSYSVAKIGVIVSNWCQQFMSGANNVMLVIKPKITINGSTVQLSYWVQSLGQPTQFNYVVDSYNDYLIVDLSNY